MPRWTAEAKQRQSEKIRRWQPWQKSTGPRTAAGKNIARRNGLKHGRRSAGYLKRMKDIRHFLRAQRRYLALARQQVRLWERLAREGRINGESRPGLGVENQSGGMIPQGPLTLFPRRDFSLSGTFPGG